MAPSSYTLCLHAVHAGTSLSLHVMQNMSTFIPMQCPFIPTPYASSPRVTRVFTACRFRGLQLVARTTCPAPLPPGTQLCVCYGPQEGKTPAPLRQRALQVGAWELVG